MTNENISSRLNVNLRVPRTQAELDVLQRVDTQHGGFDLTRDLSELLEIVTLDLHLDRRLETEERGIPDVERCDFRLLRKDVSNRRLELFLNYRRRSILSSTNEETRGMFTLLPGLARVLLNSDRRRQRTDEGQLLDFDLERRYDPVGTLDARAHR